MKIALITIKKRIYGLASKHPPLGLLSIASYLISKKIVKKEEIKIFDTSFDDPTPDLKLFKPDVITFSIMTPFYYPAIKYAKRLAKRFKNAKIIIGGVHISSIPESLKKPFEIGVVGEGEETFAELIQLLKKNKKPKKKELLKIKGIVFLDKNNKIVITPRRPLIYPLDKLPHINWSLLPKERVALKDSFLYENRPKKRKTAYIYTARGCPYQCTFCAYNAVWGQKGVRYFSPNYVAEEIEHLFKNYQVEGFRILDDTFNLNKKRIKAIINELDKRGLLGKINFFQVFVRADIIDAEMCSLLKKMGVASVFMGIESGSQKILNFLKNKTLTISQVKKAINLLGKAKINIFGSFMLFSPGENRKDLQKTLEFIRWFVQQEGARDAAIYVTTPYPGSRLWQIALNQKVITIDSKIWEKMQEEIEQMPRVFFKNKLKLEECKQIWLEAKQIASILNGKAEKKYIASRMDKRWHNLKKRPLSTSIKILQKPYKLYYAIKDAFLFCYYTLRLRLK